MKRMVSAIVIMVAAGFFVSNWASVVHAKAKPVVIKISHPVSATDPTHLGFIDFKDHIEKASEGRFKVELYPNKQLANSDVENLELLARKSIEITFTASSGLATQGNIRDFFIYDYPYFFLSDDDVYKISDGELGKEMNQKLLDKTGLKVMANYVFGWMVVSNNTREIAAPKDMSGLKLRVLPSEGYQAIMKKVGATPIAMGFGELLPALQQGTVDGVMTSPNLYISSKLYEVQKYMTDAKIGLIQHYAVTNNEWYEALPADLKAIFDESVQVYQASVRKRMADEDVDARVQLKKLMQVRDLSDAELQAWKEIFAPIVDENPGIAGEEMVKRAKAALGK